MGTNYYLVRDPKEPCACCGRPYEKEELHIGKSSGGWCFALHVIPELGLNSLYDWMAIWDTGGYYIEDEDGKWITPDEMLDIITNRSWKGKKFSIMYYKSERDFLNSNHAENGPDGLLRARLDGVHCVGHGEGTWDLIVGEFS